MEENNNQQNENNQNNNGKKGPDKSFVFMLVVAIGLTLLFYFQNNDKDIVKDFQRKVNSILR